MCLEEMKMDRLGREAALPPEMQGRWVDADDSSSELIVNGGEITCFGRLVEHDYKEVVEKGGALTVTLHVDDEASEDAFQRANITGLVITPEGEFHAYNVKFATRFVRAGS
jgi:uncharacterized glyoxalase superfamily protein PhnB